MSFTHYSGFADDSALLKHELAYCLGQMKLTTALPTLESVLRNPNEDPMVRHEACLFDPLSTTHILMKDKGCRGNGCNILLRLPSHPQRIPDRLQPERPRNLRNRYRQNRMGQL